MKLSYRGLKEDYKGITAMKIDPKKLRRPYGNGGYRTFKATLAEENYDRLCELVPTGAGKFGSALINLSIQLFYALMKGKGIVSVVEKLCRALGSDPDALRTLAENTMRFSLTLKVASDKASGDLVVIMEEE